MSGRLRLGLVDDHSLFRRGLAELLEGTEFEIAWEAGTTRDAEEAGKNSHADVIIMDVSMPGTSGIEATRSFVKRNPATRILVLTMHSGEELVVQAFLAGATGFALKTETIDDIVKAIRLTALGRLYLAESIPRSTLDAYNRRIRKLSENPLDALSPRERQVFDLAAQNTSNREIAAELGIAVKTVEAHRVAVHRKLGAHSAADLIRLAALSGMLHR